MKKFFIIHIFLILITSNVYANKELVQEINNYSDQILKDITENKILPKYKIEIFPKMYFYTYKNGSLKAIHVVMKKRVGYGLGNDEFDEDEPFISEWFYFYKNNSLIKELVIYKSLKSSKKIKGYYLVGDNKQIIFNTENVYLYFEEKDLILLFNALKKEND